MQQIENDEKQVTPPDPQSQPLAPIPLAQEEDDDPEIIFLKAVAEIDTQPLPMKREPFTFGEVLEVCLLVSVLFLSLFGVIWQCITFPHTLVIVYAKATPANITTTLSMPTRTLAPVTITRNETSATSETGHQDATQATGTLAFYNGGATPQSVPSGSVFSGTDGVKVTTDHSITIPAANLPAIGSITVSAHAVLAGRHGNIAAFDINNALSTDLKVRNEAPFNKGRDARTYQAVASADLTTLTSTGNDKVTQAFLTAFPLQPGEEAIPTQCHSTTTANHQRGDEAQSVTLTISKTCSAIAYNRQQIEQLATAAFTRTKPGTNYHLIGSVQTTVQSVTPLSVTMSGKWVYTFTPNYQQSLAESIAGKTPAQARKLLLHTGIIAYASIPSTLPPEAMYIHFFVLVG